MDKMWIEIQELATRWRERAGEYEERRANAATPLEKELCKAIAATLRNRAHELEVWYVSSARGLELTFMACDVPEMLPVEAEAPVDGC